MTSLAISGIAPFLDFADLSMFVEKISIYLLIGATFYFSRITKKDIDIKHNSDPSARDTTFLPIAMTDYRAKFNAELTSRDENFTAEIQRILTILNTSTVRLDEIEQVLQNYHNNFGRVATEFESINASIVTLQSEINQRNAMVLRTEEIEFDQQSVISQASNHSAGQASNHSSASSGQLMFTGISLTVWGRFKQIFDQIKTNNNFSLEEMCLSVAMDVRSLGGNIKKTAVQGFYERNIKKNIRPDQIGFLPLNEIYSIVYIIKLAGLTLSVIYQ